MLLEVVFAEESASLDPFGTALDVIVIRDMFFIRVGVTTIGTYPFTRRCVCRDSAERRAYPFLQREMQRFLMPRPIVFRFERVTTKSTLIDALLPLFFGFAF